MGNVAEEITSGNGAPAAAAITEQVTSNQGVAEPAASTGEEATGRNGVAEPAATVVGTDDGEKTTTKRKPRFMCIHGFRTSGDIMKAQVMGKWPEEVTSRLDLFFPDGPFPCSGKSEVEGIFPPPYYEWFQYDKDFMVYTNLETALARIEELMIEHGPFDGLMGFSQGAILSAAMTGLQSKGFALKTVPKVKYLVIIGGAMFHAPEVANRVYPSKYDCTSLHFLGEKDFLKKKGEKLLELFVDPFVIHHPKGHTVPKLDDEKNLKIMFDFLEKIENDLNEAGTNADVKEV